MGFNFGAALAGFAERDMELRDEARKEAKEIAATTLKYRAEKAMEEEAQRKEKINAAKKFGMELKTTYGFNNNHVLALAKSGQLENTVNYMRKIASTKGAVLPKADDIVSVSGQMPKGKTFEEHLSTIVGGVPTQVDVKSLYEDDKSGKKRGFLEEFFNPDFRESEFQKASEAFSGAFGMDIMQKYGDSGEYADFEASINMKPIMEQLGTDTKDKFEGLSSWMITQSDKSSTSILDNVFDTKSTFDAYGGWQGVELKGQQARDFAVIKDAARIRVAGLMETKDMDFASASSLVTNQMIDIANEYSGDKAAQQEAMLAWARGTTYEPTTEPGSPTPEPGVPTPKMEIIEGENFIDFMGRVPDSVYNSEEGQAIVSNSEMSEQEKMAAFVQLVNNTSGEGDSVVTEEVEDGASSDVNPVEVETTVKTLVDNSGMDFSDNEKEGLAKVLSTLSTGTVKLDMTDASAIKNFVVDTLGTMPQFRGADSMDMLIAAERITETIMAQSAPAEPQTTPSAVAPRMRSRN